MSTPCSYLLLAQTQIRHCIGNIESFMPPVLSVSVLGIACMIPDGLKVCMGQRMMLLRPSKDLLNKYLMYYLNSPRARTLIIESIGGTASLHINVGDIKRFTIPTIPLIQQQSVVAEIESRLSVCDNIERVVY